MIKQYLSIKEAHKDAIVFFRMGDFYEMFFEDAVTASQVLDITLTTRDKNKENSVPLCGVPYHSASPYISKLVDNGYKVAICEQVEDPEKGKGILDRRVTRIVTPGLIVDTDSLEASENNFLMSITLNKEVCGIAFLDLSTGEFRATELSDSHAITDEAARIAPREILAPTSLKGKGSFLALLESVPKYVLTYLDDEHFNCNTSFDDLSQQVEKTGPEGVDIDENREAVKAAAGIVYYITSTQKARLHHINNLVFYRLTDYMVVDENAKRNLELFNTIQSRSKKGSLIRILDKTATPMGGRKIRNWLNYPLLNIQKIEERHDAITELKDAVIVRKDLRELLKSIHDLERINSKIALSTVNARDLIQLKTSIEILPEIKRVLERFDSSLMRNLFLQFDILRDIFDLLEELNPYSVPARYPGIIVTEDNARMAIQITKEIRM